MKLVYKKWKNENEKARSSGICKTYILLFGRIKL